MSGQTETDRARPPRSALNRLIETRLYRRLAVHDTAIARLGYRVRIGIEDELYIAGPRAWDFFAERGPILTRLRAAFPEVGRVYAEADVVSLRGTPLRLGVPRIRKWEVTTRHVGADGGEIPPSRQARLVSDLRAWICRAAARTGHLACYQPRPIRDLREVIGPAGPLRLSERCLLTSLRGQVRSIRFERAVRAHFAHGVSDWTFRYVHDARRGLPDTTVADMVRAFVYHGAGDRLAACLSPGQMADVRGHRARAWRRWMATVRSIVARVERARSLAALCEEPGGVIDPRAVPSAGVDVNVSVWRGDRNAFYDAGSPDQASPLFHRVAAAAVRCIGCESGSLLPFTQSYTPATFERLFRPDLMTPSRAALGAKALGASCKLSPDSIARNPSRSIEHGFDALGEDTLRLEVRVGESGGAAGRANALAAPHAVLATLIAVRLGLEDRVAPRTPRVPDGEDPDQALDTSHDASLASFARSAILRDGYGRRLHDLVVRHACRMRPS